MNVVKCSNGHYYDSDKFSVCPHCNESINTDRGGSFYQNTSTPLRGQPRPQGNTGFLGQRSQVPVQKQQVRPMQPVQPVQPMQPVQPIQPMQSVQPVQHGHPVQPTGIPYAQPVRQPYEQPAERPFGGEWPVEKPMEKFGEEAIQNPAEVYHTPNMSIGVGLQRKVDSKDDTPMTVAYREETKRVEGWLVAIDGPLYGDFIPLYEGSNRLNDVIIEFDEEKKKFLVNVEKSSTRIDLDSRTLSENEYMYHHSRFRTHGNTFVLIELCREGFDWNNKNVIDTSTLNSSYEFITGKLKNNRKLCDICGSYNSKEEVYCSSCGARIGGSN